MEVEPVHTNSPKEKCRRSLLLVFIGIILVIQACSATTLQLDLSDPPRDIFLGSTVTIYAHVYDANYPAVKIPNAKVLGSMWSDSGESADLTTYTNASGWSVISYTPPSPGKYVYSFVAMANYSTIPGLPAVGKQASSAQPAIVVNVTRFIIPVHTNPPIVLVTATATTAPPLTTPQTTQQTTAVTPVMQVTQVTQVYPATSTVPASPTDTTPPVTTLTLAGTEDGSGGYISDVICTLSAADNNGGSGVSVTQYSFDGTSWYTYARPVSVVKRGATTLYYRSADNAGNREVAQLKAVVISSKGSVPAGTTVPGAGVVETIPAVTPTGSGSPQPLWLIALAILILLGAFAGYLYYKSRQKEEPKQ
jgi:hypothetical protein